MEEEEEGEEEETSAAKDRFVQLKFRNVATLCVSLLDCQTVFMSHYPIDLTSLRLP